VFAVMNAEPASLLRMSNETLGALLDRIAADDALCHDDQLRPLLTAIVEALDAEQPDERPASAPPMVAGTVALVRMIALHARRRPLLRARRVVDIIDKT